MHRIIGFLCKNGKRIILIASICFSYKAGSDSSKSCIFRIIFLIHPYKHYVMMKCTFINSSGLQTKLNDKIMFIAILPHHNLIFLIFSFPKKRNRRMTITYTKGAISKFVKHFPKMDTNLVVSIISHFNQ